MKHRSRAHLNATIIAFVTWAWMVFAPMQSTWSQPNRHAITLCTAQGFSTVWVDDGVDLASADWGTLSHHGQHCTLCSISATDLSPAPDVVAALSLARHAPAYFAPAQPALKAFELWAYAPRAPPLFA